jgi:hypothetical protein
MPYSDPVGANYMSYTPTKIGTYRIQALFPYTDKEIQWTGQVGMDSYVVGDHWVYSAAESAVETFEVVEEASRNGLNHPLWEPTGGVR